MCLEKATFISANFKRISSISRCPSNFSDSSLHLLQSFKVCLDTVRECSLILTRQNQCFWRSQSRELDVDLEKHLWTWKSSSELTQPYPSRETCSGAARNASLARQAERKPKSLFCKSTRSVAWGSLSYNPPKNLAPIAS